jgi:hypothetical protein
VAQPKSFLETELLIPSMLQLLLTTLVVSESELPTITTVQLLRLLIILPLIQIRSGGTDQWSFLVGEITNSNVSIGGDLIINCTGALRSDHRFLNGAGTTLTLGGNLIINNTNSDANTIITMGVNGTATYNGNITLTNTGGSNGVTFNSGVSASCYSSTMVDHLA